MSHMNHSHDRTEDDNEPAARAQALVEGTIGFALIIWAGFCKAVGSALRARASPRAKRSQARRGTGRAEITGAADGQSWSKKNAWAGQVHSRVPLADWADADRDNRVHGLLGG